MGKMKDIVIEICDLHADGKDVCQIAEELGMTYHEVNMVLDEYYDDYIKEGL